MTVALVCAPVAGADDAEFRDDLLDAGIPESSLNTLEMWAETACDLAPRLGLSDAEAAAYLPSDVASTGVTVTPEEAAIVWDSAKRNIC